MEIVQLFPEEESLFTEKFMANLWQFMFTKEKE